MAPRPTLTVTAVDLSLSRVILFPLLGLAVRAALYFHHRSGIQPRRQRDQG